MTSALPAHREQALKNAAQWYARLSEDHADAGTKQALQQWLQQDAAHRWAWGRVEQLQQQLGNVRDNTPGKLAVDTLERSDRHFTASRRSVLKGLVLTAGVSTVGWASLRHSPAQDWLADQHTATGEQRRITLDDGSLLILNTASSVDIAFTDQKRRLHLRSGEILVETAKPLSARTKDARPFIVTTRNGQVRALGTRFSVRELDDRTQVSVFEHSVEITNRKGQKLQFASGQAASFTDNIIQATAFVENKDAWTKQLLVVDAMPLDKFAAELSRYRSGILRCDPAIAHHRISGAFRLDDTDQALRAIAKSFPVEVNYRTRYWVTINPQ